MEDCEALAADYISMELFFSKLTCWKSGAAATAGEQELSSAMARL